MSRAAGTRSKPSRCERNLARAIGKRCRGRTLVLGRPFAALADRLERGESGYLLRRLDEGPALPTELGERRFGTVVLVAALEYVESRESLELLRGAFVLLEPRGQLLVCVPHGDHTDDPHLLQRFTRAGLKRLLKKIDQPKTYTDQPYGWLLMGLVRDPELDHASAERCRVIAGLCRGRVMELGCGPGHLSAEIARRGLMVTAVDKNAPKIEAARRRYPGIEFRQADILDLSEPATFDTVVLAEVLEHVPAEVGRRMLARAWSLVASGGRLVVSVPNEDCVRHHNHLCEYNEDDLFSMLTTCGSPQVITDQPFKWLLMHVDRPPEAGGRIEGA